MAVTRYRREPLTADEATRLAQSCVTATERLVIFTLLDTGLRLEELCGIRRENIDTQGGTLTVTGKGRKRRVVPLTSRSRGIIEHHWAANDTLPVGRRDVQRLVRRVARKAHIRRPCSPHVLRHTFAVLALQRGVSVAAVSRLLGHEDLNTTALYLNLSNAEAIREFVAKS